MDHFQNNSEAEINELSRITFLPLLLEVVCMATGMGFAAIAKVSECNWVAVIVRDAIQFGLKAGGELPLTTTICNEIRQHGSPVAINCVAHDAAYHNHHTPAMYAFQSYISYPIVLQDGSFYGTLCAIDPHPAQVETPMIQRLFLILSKLVGECIDHHKQPVSGDHSKFAFHAASELKSFHSEMLASGPEFNAAISGKMMHQLLYKIELLQMALDPNGSFLTSRK